MLRRMRRVLAISAIVVAALVVIGLLVLHSNPVQSRVLSWSIGELERRFDLDLTADDLHYNLGARRVEMTRVRLAATGHHDDPFFTADRVFVQLPWVVFRGQLRFDHIAVDNSRVTITRDANGVSNLPPGRGHRDPNAPERRVDIRGLQIDRLDFSYRDLQRDLEILAPGFTNNLQYAAGEGAAGPFAFNSELLVRIRERRVGISPVTGRMSFEGSDVGFADVQLKTTEGTFTMGGLIDRALDEPTLDLRFKGTTEIGRVAYWTTPPVDLAGNIAIEATMTGVPSAFVLDSTVRGQHATIGAERDVALEAVSRLTLNGVKVSRSAIKPATGGQIHATLDVPFGEDTAWWIKADYANLDAAAAFRLGQVNPLPFGAALSGTARFDREAGKPYRLEVHNRSTPRSARGTAPLTGEVEFVVEGDRWRANQRHRVASTAVEGQIGGVWNRQSVPRSTFDGKLNLRTGDVGEAARVAALFGLSTPAIITSSRGPLDASVTMAGEFAAPRFIGKATSRGLEIAPVGTVSFSADFDASPRALSVTAIDAHVVAAAAARSNPAHLTGSVLANFETRRLAGALDVDAPSIAELLANVPAALRVEGPIMARATIGGTVDRPEIAADVTGSGLTVGGYPVDALSAKARLLGNDLAVESLTLRQAGGGELQVSGRYNLSTKTYQVDANGQRLAWQGTLARLGDAAANFSLKFAGEGTIDRPTGEGVIEFDVSGGLAGELIDRGVINVRLTGDLAQVTGTIPSLGALITANIEPREPFNYDAVVVMNDIDVGPPIALAGLRPGHVTGTASLSASAKGQLSRIAESQAFINLQEIEADASGVRIRLVTPARLSWDGRALNLDAIDVSVGQGGLRAAGRVGDAGGARFEATFKGELGELLKIGRPFGVPAELEGFGPVNIAWQSTGGLEQSTGSVQLAGGSLGWGTLPAVRDLALEATFDGQSLNVTRLTGKWQDGGIEGTASIPRAVLQAADRGAALPGGQPGFARLRVIGLSQTALAPWLNPATLTAIDGRVSATLDTQIARASIDGISGKLVVDEADFTVAGVRVNQVRPMAFTIASGVVTADDVAFNAGGSPLALTGTARIAPADQQQLNLNLRGNADLRILSAFAPTVASEGEARVSIGIGGALGAPVFSGRIDIANTEVAIREPRIVVSELGGTIAFDGKRVVFDSIKGSANGGFLTLDGGFLLNGFTPSAGGLTIQLERAAFEYPAGLQSEANAIVTLHPTPAGWTLSGEILVERSAYNQPISLPSLIAARRSRPPVVEGSESWFDRARLNLFVSTQQDLVLDNNYGRLEAGAAVRVLGTGGEPVLSGRITMREGGEVYLGGRTFHLDRGSISFTNPFRIVPEFDIQLRTQVSSTDLTLTLEGPIDRLQTEVRSSDPTVDSREAMSMIFGGFQGEDAVALLSAELLGATGRSIGLDTIRVERGIDEDEFRADPGLVANETDPATRLTLSKRLRPDVELTLSQSLRDSGDLTAIVSYKPRRNIEVRLSSKDNRDTAVALRHEITFGGAGTADPTLAQQPVITEITISGTPGEAAETLIGLLKLKVGDRFNFYEWQRDHDILRSHYHDRLRYEARVRATRQLSPDGTTVTLNYQITPGPMTELVIEGHTLEPNLEQDIRDAWMRTIFDRFLIEDVEQRILRHLIEDDIIGSTVEAAVTVSGDRKQLRVTVKPGTTVGKREVRYAGARAFDADRLDTVIRDAGLEPDGWLDPARVVEALASFYRSEGYLEVSVKAAAPTVDGQLGVLPVTIEENRRFVIGTVTFAGVNPASFPDLAGVVNLDPDVPYRSDLLDQARGRLEVYYANRGFNEAQIEVDAEPDMESGRVAIEFAMLEGLQQVLREVTTVGATLTRPGVIRQALRLREGQPVNLADWSQARKRLYDTNVFRQVDIEAVPMEPTTEDSGSGIQPVRAVVRVAEYPVWRLRYGVQLNNETTDIPEADGDTRQQNIGVLTDLQNQNLFGRAITAGIAGRYERNQQAGSLFMSNSSFFGLPIRSSGFVFTSRQRFILDGEVASIDRRTGFSAEQRWRPTRRAELIWSYRFERTHTFDPDPAPADPFPLDITINISRLNAGMFMDRRDDPSDPTRGWFVSANVEQSIRALGSDYGNIKLLLQQSVYRGLKRLVFAGRAQFGSGFGDEALILSERFQLGGATTVRGYAENSLGPRDFLGFPEGGDALLLFNGELRFPVRGWVQGVAFVDAGNVFASRSDLAVRDLVVGYGIGLRLASPFAMIRVDFGLPASTIVPDRPANQWRSGRWYFGIGHIF